jgi:hypothetical protein
MFSPDPVINTLMLMLIIVIAISAAIMIVFELERYRKFIDGRKKK